MKLNEIHESNRINQSRSNKRNSFSLHSSTSEFRLHSFYYNSIIVDNEVELMKYYLNLV